MQLLSSSSTHKRIDKILLIALILPITCYIFFTKWAVVFETTAKEPLILEWLVFFTTHLAYYSVLFVYVKTLLLNTTHVVFFRLLSLIIFFVLVVVELGYSTAIYFTGTLAPLEVAYYMSLGLGNTDITLQQFYLMMFIIFPTLIISTVLAKLYVTQKNSSVQEQKTTYWHITTGLFCFAILCIPPTLDVLEKNKATPSITYLLKSGFETLQLTKEPIPTLKMGENQTANTDATLLSHNTKPMNIAIITLESVGSYAVDHYNKLTRNVTPQINKLIEKSLVAENAYTVMPHTSKALVGILCGQYPYLKHPVFESSLGTPSPCLAKLLMSAGYATAYFQSPTEFFENRRGLMENIGFEDFYSSENMDQSKFELVNYFGPEDDIMLEPSRNWLTQQQKPFLAYYLTGTSHHPYNTPSHHSAQEFINDPNQKKLNDYLNTVNYVDSFVGKVLDQYKELGLYHNTLFVIVGDHGESIGKHGRFQHNVSLYQETIQIPLIFHSPTLFKKRKIVTHATSQIDILPTILDLLDLQTTGRLAGKSMTSPRAEMNPLVSSYCWYDRWCMSNVDSKFKYIYNFSEKKEELYDLTADPEEINNIATSLPLIAQQRREEIFKHYEDNRKTYNAYFSSLDKRYQDNLASTVSRNISLHSKKHIQNSRTQQ